MNSQSGLGIHQPTDLNRVPGIQVLSGGQGVMIERDAEYASEEG
jgi:hypothetical protein